MKARNRSARSLSARTMRSGILEQGLKAPGMEEGWGILEDDDPGYGGLRGPPGGNTAPTGLNFGSDTVGAGFDPRRFMNGPGGLFGGGGLAPEEAQERALVRRGGLLPHWS